MTDLTITDPAIQEILANAATAAGPQLQEVAPGALLAFRDIGGDVQIIDTDEYATIPRQQHRQPVVHDPKSFCTYVMRVTDPELTGMQHEPKEAQVQIYADAENLRVLGKVDGLIGRGTDKVHLALQQAPEWGDWARISGQPLGQVELAEFLEDHMADLAAVEGQDGSRILSIVQTLQGKTSVTWESSELLANGSRRARWVESVDAKAGEKGDLEIPTRLKLALRPFRGADKFAVDAAFRFRIAGGNVMFTVNLLGTDRIIETAMDEVIHTIEDTLEAPVMKGWA